MENKKTTLYVGLNDKDKKIQIIDTVEAVKVVTNVITAICDGGTIYNAQGVYTHDDGTIIIENTLKIELVNVDGKTIEKLVMILKNTLNQESILIERAIVNTDFC